MLTVVKGGTRNSVIWLASFPLPETLINKLEEAKLVETCFLYSFFSTMMVYKLLHGMETTCTLFIHMLMN